MYTKTILIVDDEPLTRQGIKRTLENWGGGAIQIIIAANGEEAINVMKEQKINILLTDIRMPKMTGLAMLEMIKQQNKPPVVIVISAYSEFEYAQEALKLGVVNYLLKPISKKKLIEAVEQAIKIQEKQERVGIIEQIVDDKLIDITTKKHHISVPIQTAIRYINENFDKELTLKEVAECVHLNPSYFSVIFKEQTNLTFSEYLTRTRIQAAKKLLISTDLLITEVAEKSGYKTSKYFIKLFKELVGVTPSVYRKREN